MKKKKSDKINIYLDRKYIKESVRWDANKCIEACF